MIRLALPSPRSDAGKHDYDRPDRETAAAISWSVQQERDRFLNMPPKKQQARLDEVLDKLRREKRSGRNSHSALWKIAGPVFGIEVEEL